MEHKASSDPDIGCTSISKHNAAFPKSKQVCLKKYIKVGSYREFFPYLLVLIFVPGLRELLQSNFFTFTREFTEVTIPP
jgi:hypothetical protein